ncbi:peptide ABC transporter substrate-binding protein [Magnetospirillum sp. UT-4]|uniref:peptide ABC transporter substrate-binding protein n=1 Tax=Magnetospirillum sp. UT-4 TaxID=2681467 RepID=UPI001381885F|nr:peptide ABC transporter substrate-binding protein [Magnetospirillum sp. UT-4]CAA7613194.1 ABC-type dipeptide transport system [Magnetospirillum sp. UT-4]
MPPPYRLVVLVLALCAALAQPVRAKDDLTIGITQYPATFHPNIESMLAKTYILDMATRPFTAFDAEWKLVCMLCERLPTIENGLAVAEKTPEGKPGVALSFTIKAGAKWGDGKPVTTEDVMFTWQVGKHPLSGVADAELYRRILRVEIKDERNFVLHLDRLTFDYNAINDFRIVPAHIEAPRFFDAPGEYRNRTAYDQDSANPGLYNGPYRIASAVQGSHVVLVPNAHWNGAKPAFARIVVKTVENTAALEANLLSGGVDMIAGELGLPLEQAIAFEKREGQKKGNGRFTVLYKPGLVYEHLDVNLASPVLADQRVRQALMWGMDREAISKQLFAGRQPVAHSAVNPLDGVHAADVPRYSFDAAKAAALLDQAGWRMNGGGRRNAQGEALVLEIATTAGNRSRELVSQVLQGQWRRLGIDVRLKSEPPRVFFGDTVTRRRFPHLALFAWYSAPESVPRSTLHSTMIPREDNNFSGQNYTGYGNPRMDELLDAIEVELDRKKRTALWRELQLLYARDLPALPLFFKADAHILPKALKGVVPTGHQDPTTLWVETWRWE